jgi:hypothetical protein
MEPPPPILYVILYVQQSDINHVDFIYFLKCIFVYEDIIIQLVTSLTALL